MTLECRRTTVLRKNRFIQRTACCRRAHSSRRVGEPPFALRPSAQMRKERNVRGGAEEDHDVLEARERKTTSRSANKVQSRLIQLAAREQAATCRGCSWWRGFGKRDRKTRIGQKEKGVFAAVPGVLGLHSLLLLRPTVNALETSSRSDSVVGTPTKRRVDSPMRQPRGQRTAKRNPIRMKRTSQVQSTGFH